MEIENLGCSKPAVWPGIVVLFGQIKTWKMRVMFRYDNKRIIATCYDSEERAVF
jgi:hypothetical protein